MESACKYVAYFRVSTERQGVSGLGLEAQQISVNQYVARTGGELLAEYVEVESGRKIDRPQLTAAIAKAKKLGAVLLIAKLDRLARRASRIRLGDPLNPETTMGPLISRKQQQRVLDYVGSRSPPFGDQNEAVDQRRCRADIDDRCERRKIDYNVVIGRP